MTLDEARYIVTTLKELHRDIELEGDTFYRWSALETALSGFRGACILRYGFDWEAQIRRLL